ncbi:MAG: bifunctional riboflavin kinase/FAD synthetase [Firmicutes bacterium]|nr:bifunctional riboflavin kinase/FAD synthetase [Bacillota bacterium]
MVVYNSLEEIKNIEPSCVALGKFDGVHAGHQVLISKAVKKAKELGLKSSVFTFSNHPKNLIPGQKPVKNIIYQEEKAELIEKLGVDYLFNIEFTKEFMQTTPEGYIRNFLVDKFNAKDIFCGFNYRFGFKAAGDGNFLRACSKKYGYNVNQIEPVIIDGDVVSSTLIRGLIMAGEMEECAKYLGRVYDIGGEVVVGNRLGKSIGFPTSNITLDESMVLPPNGVYVTYCLYNGVRYPSITNVGVKPTIGEFKKNMETHIFNFDKELYGKKIKIEFLKKTRDEVKFNGVEELSAQIEKDCNEAREYHGL